MNWISENKFLTGFIAFMVIALGALGFMLFEASASYASVHEEYLQKVARLNDLQNRQLYPSPDNLAKYKEQKTALATVINKLETDLANVQFPLDPDMTPQAFQDKLRDAVNRALVKARGAGIKVPDKFALGFDTYLAGPPKPEAAPQLGRELSAVDFLVNELLDAHVVSVASPTPFNRTPLPEETGAKPPRELVRKSFMDVSFTCDQGTLRKILDDMAQTGKQFYIVRQIQIKNQNEKGTSKTSALANRKTKTGITALLVGGEKLDVLMKLEIVNFNPPAQK